MSEPALSATACASCGTPVRGACPICDWRLSAGDGEEIPPQRRRMIMLAAAAGVALPAALFAAAVAAYVRG